MIQLDLMGDVLRRAGLGPSLTRLDVAVAWASPGLEEALELAARLRMFGMRAVVDTRTRRLAAALEWRAGLGARHLLHLAGRSRVAWAPADGPVRRLPVDQVVGRLAERGGR
jgi:hypothetical protein